MPDLTKRVQFSSLHEALARAELEANTGLYACDNANQAMLRLTISKYRTLGKMSCLKVPITVRNAIIKSVSDANNIRKDSALGKPVNPLLVAQI